LNLSELFRPDEAPIAELAEDHERRGRRAQAGELVQA
jgi:hypothetical protein